MVVRFGILDNLLKNFFKYYNYNSLKMDPARKKIIKKTLNFVAKVLASRTLHALGIYVWKIKPDP